MGRHLGSRLFRIDRPCLTVNDVAVDAVLDVWRAIGDSEIRWVLVSFSVNSKVASPAQ